jgi:hypothetical protein
VIVLGLGLISCNRDHARQAGREAYKASQDAKREASEAAKELRSAGREFSQGWAEEKHRQVAPQAKHPGPAREKKQK